MTTTYNKLRKAGHGALESWRTAKTVEQFEQMESDGLVRLQAIPEEENYFDVYGKPDGYVDMHGRRVSAEQEYKELCETIDRNGCWRTVSEYFDGEHWQHADSVGMHTGYRNVLSPVENCYVVDLMRAAIDAAEANCVAVAI